MSDKNGMAILNEPLHGIVIPSILFTVGLGLLTYLTEDVKYLTIGITALVLFLSSRTYIAFSRRKSIHESKWNPLELEEKTIITKNTALYRFKLRTSLETLDVPPGYHLAVKVPVDGKDQIRYYTPISNKFAAGYFDILVKSYKDGKVSKWFAGLKPGDTVDFKGPVGRFGYTTNSSRRIGMVAGGSGITPMLSVLNEIVTTPEDSTKVSLIYANQTENDIALKDELDELAEKYPNFEVHYVLDSPSAGWEGDVGYVTKELMMKYLPPPSEDNRLVICGPPQMKQLVLDLSAEIGWPKGMMKSKPEDKVFVF
ncbi:HDL440Wp [Eremothecium sinecaudum]|uniref:NADH-cytochrome b5 reductase n=1 Tax=Eremothecium sinecaudum TaxID=45286 RepID=A0A0X8HRW4_9SACH|nr:HDL440Wp [Eremothecium sinecaudum]AMD20304.1 HDL440Wp [Eremothecium sinecaudum]